jgi:DNA-binding PadR family transcriptional regulator
MSTAPPVSGQADPEELLPYLTAAQREILLFLGDEYAGEVHPVTADDLQAAVDDRGAHGSVQTAVESLIEWRLVERSRTLGEDGDRVTRYLLTQRGKELVLEHKAALEKAPEPIDQWSAEKLKRAPLSTTELLARTLNGLAALREELEG